MRYILCIILLQNKWYDIVVTLFSYFFMVTEPRTMGDRSRHAGEVMPCILKRGSANPVVEAAKGGEKPKGCRVTVEVTLEGKVRTPKRSGMTMEVMLDGQVRKPKRSGVTREITLDGQMETPKRFGVTREVTLNGQGGIQT